MVLRQRVAEALLSNPGGPSTTSEVPRSRLMKERPTTGAHRALVGQAFGRSRMGTNTRKDSTTRTSERSNVPPEKPPPRWQIPLQQIIHQVLPAHPWQQLPRSLLDILSGLTMPRSRKQRKTKTRKMRTTPYPMGMDFMAMVMTNAVYPKGSGNREM